MSEAALKRTVKLFFGHFSLDIETVSVHRHIIKISQKTEASGEIDSYQVQSASLENLRRA